MDADVILPVEYKMCDEEAMKVRTENGKIVQITKLMSLNVTEGEFIGMVAFQKEVVSGLKEKEFAAYFESAVQWLLDEENFDVKAVSTEDALWAEIDFAEDYEKVAAKYSR